MPQEKIEEILARAKEVAVQYYEVTGKPLGITGEVGEYEAARLLDLRLEAARAPGFDATDEVGTRYQIKSRALSTEDRRRSQRVGKINLEHEWDKVVLVLMNKSFDTSEIWEAEREAVKKALQCPGSKARNERGQLAVSQFRNIGRRIWPRV